MQVELDYVCKHDMPKPWSTCTECMFLPEGERPVPPGVIVLSTRTKASQGAKKKARRGAMPKTAKDPIPDLIGDKDISYSVQDVTAHVGQDWLYASVFPWHLRPGGWIYLRNGGFLHARVRVAGIGFRESRPEQTGEEQPEDRGPGSVLTLYEETWQRLVIDLGSEASRQTQGIRYLVTSPDRKVVHLLAKEPVPEDFEMDPAYTRPAIAS